MGIVKPLLIAGSGGTLVTGAYFISGYLLPKKENEVRSIRDSLKGKRLISSLKGTALIKQWEEEFDSDKSNIRILIGFNSDEKVAGGKALEFWCSNQMLLNAEGHILENVKKYCLIRSVSSQISRKGKNLLKSSVGAGWSETYRKRKQGSSNREDIGLTKVDWGTADEASDIKKVKEWCSDNSESEFLVSENGDAPIYNKVLSWCTKEGE